MKKTILLSMALVYAICINAQTSDKKWGIGVGAGAYTSLQNDGIGFMPELYFSRYLGSRVDLSLKGNVGLFNSKLTENLDLVSGFLDFKFKLAGESKKFRPYLFAGPGYLANNSESNISFNAGAGAKLYVGSATALYLEAGYINGIKTTVSGVDDTENFGKATLGIEFDFGKTKDSDMDGVPDKKDKCPNTPTGVAVDKNGCPLDSDGDGVADYIDDCPTVAGLTSLKGCPDRDGDGIADKDDDCPDVAGVASLKGCPDADGDGVTDKNDRCPDTPKGVAVDADGCPLDQDKDGVIDAEDECPTIAGPKDNNGCPVKEVKVEETKVITAEQVIIQKIKTDPVHFPSNQSYLTDYSKNILNKLIKTLKSDPLYHVNAFGYTDSQGSDDLNIKLSQARVNSVVEYLVSKGISKDRILEQEAFGKSKPVATNDTPEGRLQNRRVEFEIFKMK